MPGLSSLAHSGGCVCKLGPAVLRQLLASQPAAGPFERRLVADETSDDATVWELDDGTCVIATTDFFIPEVSDPVDFGCIATTNAISDVDAMSGRPILALAILGMPLGKIDPEVVARILRGVAEIWVEAGIPVAGGHAIGTLEPIDGLAVIGTCRREAV